jgi:hypothetical protein
MEAMAEVWQQVVMENSLKMAQQSRNTSLYQYFLLD